MEQLSSQIKDYAKDIKLNFSSVLTEEGSLGLTQKQIVMLALSCAYSLKNPQLQTDLMDEYAKLLTDEDLFGIKAAVSLMAMNNVYYRFVHLAHNETLSKMPTKLRMNVMRDPKVSKLDFELLSLGVSILNGCGMCIASHINSVKQHGATDEAIASVGRIAAVMKAMDQALYLAQA